MGHSGGRSGPVQPAKNPEKTAVFGPFEAPKARFAGKNGPGSPDLPVFSGFLAVSGLHFLEQVL